MTVIELRPYGPTIPVGQYAATLAAFAEDTDRDDCPITPTQAVAELSLIALLDEIRLGLVELTEATTGTAVAYTVAAVAELLARWPGGDL